MGDGKLLGRAEQMISAFSAACGSALAECRAIAPTSLPRPSMSQLIQAHVEREAIERAAGNHGDGMIVHEKKEFVGAAAMIDPRFGFEARTENGWTRLRKLHFVEGRRAPPRTWLDFIKHDHRRSPDEMGNAGNLVQS
jgi:hypothetical protein